MNYDNCGIGFQVQAFYPHKLVTTNLIGNFDPTTGINTNYWDNQVGGQNNLRRFNSITHNNSTPHNFAFDGSNDYFGEAQEGYGGSTFYFDTSDHLSVGQWFKHSNNKRHIIFTMNYGGNDVILAEVSHTNNNRISVVGAGEGTVHFSYTFSNNTWYYVGISVDQGNGATKLYVNGQLEEEGTSGFSNAGDSVFQIGKRAGSSVYSGSGIKLAHTHLYNAIVTGPTFRKNYLATHNPRTSLTYGVDFTA